MVQRKNQHFVPQFYFRQFTDQERINAYHIESSNTYNELIKNVCSRDYFYSENTDIEKALSGIEGRWAKVIRKVEQDESFQNLDDEEFAFFDWFFLFQGLRTRKMKESLQNMTDNFVANIFSGEVVPDIPNARNIGEMFENGELTVKDHKLQLLSLLNSLPMTGLLSDLHCTLIRNNTDQDFIFGDHPVIRYNSAFAYINENGVCGYQSRGLQIICPISPTLTVMYFDPVVYRVIHSESQELIEATERDVHELNKLQTLKANNNLYLTEDPDIGQIQDYVDEVNKYRQEDKVVMKKESSGEGIELIHGYRRIPNYKPEFSFLKWASTTPYYAPRSPEILSSVRNLRSDMNKDFGLE